MLRLFAIANLVFASTLLSYAQAQTAPTTPDPPTGLSGLAISPTISKISWSAPVNNGGSKITGYKIEVKAIPGDYTVLVANNANTTYKHTGLTTGKTYVYRVSAINSIGSSTPSGEVVVMPKKSSSVTNSSPTPVQPATVQSPTTTSNNAVVPSQPTGLTATMTSSSSILLSWTAPSSNSASITGYKIEFKTDADQWSVLVANTGTVNSYSVTGLTTGTVYTFRISAINPSGTGDPSNVVSVATKSTTTPTALTAMATSPTSILLSWVAPSQNFGQTVSGYKIERNLGNNNFDTVISSTGSITSSYTITGLTTGKLYTFVVSAVYGSTSSGQSNTASATPLSTSKAPASISSGNSASLSSSTPSIQMPKNQQDVKKKTEDKSTIIQNSETAMEKAAKAANQKAIADAKAKMQKRIAASKNGTSIAVIPSTEKQKAAQKLKEIQAENDKLNQRLKAALGNHG
jgi:titin